MRVLPSKPPRKTQSAFWSKVVKSTEDDGCWIFTGAVSSPDGYGRVNFTVNGSQFTISAHRFALWLSGVNIADSEIVGDHRCHEPLCVRVGPEHLIASSQSANAAYGRQSGRARGTRPGLATSDRTRSQRSVDVRAAVIDGWDERAYRAAARAPHNPAREPTLFDL